MLKVRDPIFRTERLLRPAALRGAFARADKLFVLTVLLPTFLATLYFGLFASDVYVSESEFVVQSPDKPATSGLGVLLKSTGFSSSGDEVFAAERFVQSRDALRALNRDNAVRRAYGNDGVSIFDRYNPLGLSGSFEDLYDYYTGKIGIEYDSSTSIARLTVRAFDPQDAYKFNRQLLELAEGMVNRLNTRGRNDVVQFAAQEVRDAQVAARNAAVALAAFRNTHGVVNPEEQAKAQLEMISKLQDELISSRVQLQQLQAMAPENPQVPLLQTRIHGLFRNSLRRSSPSSCSIQPSELPSGAGSDSAVISYAGRSSPLATGE